MKDEPQRLVVSKEILEVWGKLGSEKVLCDGGGLELQGVMQSSENGVLWKHLVNAHSSLFHGHSPTPSHQLTVTGQPRP